MKLKRALISVSDKTNLAEFARELSKLNIELISTSGTLKFLRENKIPAKDISEYTNFPELFDGRVKTLHPKIFSGILAVRGKKEHTKQMYEHGIPEIDLVVVNLYPFEKTVEKNASFGEVIENIDIGGPSLIRAAAKNSESVAVVVSPEQYEKVIKELKENGAVSSELRIELAREAFERTAAYDIAIANYFQKRAKTEFPKELLLHFKKSFDLRYGENNFQRAAFYTDLKPEGSCVSNTTQLHGLQLSYNNILDLNTAIEIVADFEKPTAAILKHTNPCGVASSQKISEAFKLAYESDAISAYGSVVGLNRKCDLEAAKEISSHFVEIVAATDFEKEALEILKQKQKMRIVKINEKLTPNKENFLLKIRGGLLVQTSDYNPLDEKNLKNVTKRKPTKSELEDMLFAWKVCRFVKSNAVVLAKNQATIGIGAGQMSRVDSSFIACKKAGEKAKNSVLASDAFFPFKDGVEEAAKAGVSAIIQPGGSIRDEEVIKCAEQNNIAMVLTGVRAFRH